MHLDKKTYLRIIDPSHHLILQKLEQLSMIINDSCHVL